MARYDLIVRGGKVCTADSTQTADIAIRGGKIVKIGQNLVPGDGTREIDARGKKVLPGAIDVHVHLQLPVGNTVSADDFESGTRAAAMGGVTTIIDFANQDPDPKTGHSLLKGIEDRMAKAEGKVCIDYSLHGVLNKWKALDKKELPRAVARGITSFKMFMIYESRGLQSDDGDVFAALECMRAMDTTLCIHAESERVMNLLIERWHKKRKVVGAYGHCLSRPNFVEAEAIQRATLWSEITGGRLYIVHMSTGEGADIVKAAKERGIPVYGETCPQYLIFNDEVFKDKSTGHLWATCPQIKGRKDNARLWKGLKDGEVSIVSTDTCSFTRKQKAAWKGDFTKIPYGLPGVETLLPSLYTFGVKKHRFSINHLVRLVSTNPAKFFGLYPQKGTIAVGSDADLIIIDPKREMLIDAKKLESNCDWSPFEGQSLYGFPEVTLSRGRVIGEKGKFCGKAGAGRFVQRRTGNLLE